MKICVYCSSSDAVPENYITTAEKTGKLIAENGHSLIYGGASVGSMGAVARGVKAGGGRIIGVMPEKLHAHGLGFTGVDEEIITSTMRERKGIMEENADAFLALPGGIGTLEEIFEVMVLKQLGYHNRPVVFVDTGGFYTPLFNFLAGLYRENFMKEGTRQQYFLAASPEEALGYIENYTPPENVAKWFNHSR